MDLFTLLFAFILLMVMSGISIRALAPPEPMEAKARLALVASAIIPSGGFLTALFYFFSNKFPGSDNLSSMFVIFGFFMSGLFSFYSFLMLREKGNTSMKIVQTFGGIYFFIICVIQLIWLVLFFSDLLAVIEKFKT